MSSTAADMSFDLKQVLRNQEVIQKNQQNIISTLSQQEYDRLHNQKNQKAHDSTHVEQVMKNTELINQVLTNQQVSQSVMTDCTHRHILTAFIF